MDVDDVMNGSGRRISTIEVESALVDRPDVAEGAVCERHDAATGQAIVAFVSLKTVAESSVDKLNELGNHVARTTTLADPSVVQELCQRSQSEREAE